MVLLAACDVLLYRYSGAADIAVRTAIANRNRGETESLIGFFVNMLVMRTDLTGNPTFRDLLKRVKQMTLSAYQHQDVPFEQIIEMLQPQRSLNRSPLYQVEFVLQNAFHRIKSITVETRAGDEISVGHFKPISSRRFVTDCHELRGCQIPHTSRLWSAAQILPFTLVNKDAKQQ